MSQLVLAPIPVRVYTPERVREHRRSELRASWELILQSKIRLSTLLALLLFPTTAGAAIPDLLAVIQKSTDTTTVEDAETALGREVPRSEGDITLLLTAMHDTHAAPYAQMAVQRSSDAALGPALLKALASSSKELERRPDSELEKLPLATREEALRKAMNVGAIISALGHVKYSPAIDEIRSLLAYDQRFFQGYISGVASFVLGELGDRQSLETLTKSAQTSAAVSLAGYGIPGIEHLVVKIDEIRADVALHPWQGKGPDKRLWEIDSLADKIGWSGSKDTQATKLFLRLLRHPAQSVQWGASRAIEESMSSSDKDITREMLRHPEPYVRRHGLHSLWYARTWDESFLPSLIGIVNNDPDQSVRSAALSTLLNLRVPRLSLAPAIPVVKSSLHDKSSTIRGDAYQTYRALTGRWPGEPAEFGLEQYYKLPGPEYFPEYPQPKDAEPK